MEIDFSELSKKDRYFFTTAAVVPRPIAFVSTVSTEGKTNLAPFSYFSGVASDPPVVSVSIGVRKEGGPKDTLKNIQETKQCVINVVTADMAQAMVNTSKAFPYGESEFEACGFTPIASSQVAAPRVKESPLSFECILFQLVPVGEAITMVLAEIQVAHVSDALLKNGLPDIEKLKPLARLGGAQYALLGAPFELKPE